MFIKKSIDIRNETVHHCVDILHIIYFTPANLGYIIFKFNEVEFNKTTLSNVLWRKFFLQGSKYSKYNISWSLNVTYLCVTEETYS